MAPVAKRRKMFSTGSTSSMGMAARLRRNSSKLRSVTAFSDWSLTAFAVFFEYLVIAGARGVLQQVDGRGVEQVGLALPFPLVNAADGQAVHWDAFGALKCQMVFGQCFPGNFVQPQAFDA